MSVAIKMVKRRPMGTPVRRRRRPSRNATLVKRGRRLGQRRKVSDRPMSTNPVKPYVKF